MTPYLIIDGYNLMHAAGIARASYGPGDLERCRARLNRELIGALSSDVLHKATIVYDAFESISDENREQIQDGLMILYAPQGSDADSQIERLLSQHSVPKRVVVVSSDHRLHKAAQRRRAKCVDSEEFWASLNVEALTKSSGSANTIPAKDDAAPTVPAADVIDDLQRWVDEKESSEKTDESAAGAAFDEDYLRQLKKDVNDGRIR